MDRGDLYVTHLNSNGEGGSQNSEDLVIMCESCFGKKYRRRLWWRSCKRFIANLLRK